MVMYATMQQTFRWTGWPLGGGGLSKAHQAGLVDCSCTHGLDGLHGLAWTGASMQTLYGMLCDTAV